MNRIAHRMLPHLVSIRETNDESTCYTMGYGRLNQEHWTMYFPRSGYDHPEMYVFDRESPHGDYARLPRNWACI